MFKFFKKETKKTWKVVCSDYATGYSSIVKVFDNYEDAVKYTEECNFDNDNMTIEWSVL